MKATLIPLFALSLFVAGCDGPVITDEIPVSERENWSRGSSPQITITDGSNNYRGSGDYRGSSDWRSDQPNSFNIRCPYSDPYTVRYPNADRDSIRTNFGGSQTLGRVRSANGEKYSNGEYEIWLNGNEALLTNYLGNTVECRVTTR